MACGDVCPKQCINFPLKGDGHWHPVVNHDCCIQCLSCEHACPVLSKQKELSAASRPFAAWTNDDAMRLRSSSGGTFAQIAQRFIVDGGYAAGAVIDGVEVKHIVTNNVDDLPLLQGSKYIQSNTHGVYSEMKELLKNGNRVLFSGTGCQVAAIYNIVPERFWSNLFTIDLICHGVPSRYDLKRYLDMHDKKIIKINSFRDKTWKFGYAMTCTCEDGSIVRDDENYFYSAFNNNKSLRWACYNCKFKTGLQRCSDITIGDFWGGNQFMEQRSKGLSLCIIHSEKGKELLETSDLENHEIEWEECLPKNKDYFYANNLFRFNPIRWLYPVIIKCGEKTIKHYIGSIELSRKKHILLILLDSIFQHFSLSINNKAIKKILCRLKK
jgi:coenzyme F420-reducing hydrogenase beta subunit